VDCNAEENDELTLLFLQGAGEILKRAVSGMLPKNNLRRKRLERLKIFDDTNTGGVLKNAIKRYDNIVIPAATKTVAGSSIQKNDPGRNLLPQNEPSTIVKYLDDTPAPGSLGGLKPSYMYTPKAKKVKERKKKTPPGEQKIFDERGNEIGKAHWKQRKQKSTTIQAD